MENINEAPWYDAEDTSTHLFMGVNALSIEGIMDSTREATVTEGITDGGVVGQVRRAVRQVRVRAMLTGKGENGLEAGLAWLKAALDPDFCGVHGSACGAVDTCFYVACPPEPTDFTNPETVWNDAVTNWAPNPRAISTGTGFPSSVGAVTFITNFPGAVHTAARNTQPAAVRQVFGVGVGTAIPASTLITVQMQVRASAELTNVTGIHRPGGPGVTTGEVIWTAGVPATIPAGTVISVQWVGTTSATAPAAGSTIGLAYDAPAGTTLDITTISIVQGDYDGPYFDGSMTDVLNPPTEYAWTGAANNSASTYRTGTIVQVPDAEAWTIAVDKLVRTLHNVTCISGPLIEQKLHSESGDLWGYIVEFTLAAATPWVYGLTRPIQAEPTIPEIVQDVPFNLVPYPSAELAAGNVVVATNFAPNPSVETNATDWSTAVDGTAILSANVTGARSTVLAAVGTASYRVVFTAPSAGANGWVGGNQLVLLPGLATGQRISINMWATGQVASGTAVLGALEIRAYWQDAGGVTLRDELVGTVPPVTGGAVSVKSILPPVGTVRVYVRSVQRVTSWSSGAVIHVYSDALAVTTP